jgi:antitoxin component YwqK of YwqJK toxin-antitoxin module
MKNKLFIPRKIEGEGSRWEQWNKIQPFKDGIQINQYDLDGIKQGYWEDYYLNGVLSYKGSFINGKKDGVWEEYWRNGKLYSKGLYGNDLMNGMWEYYDINGNLLKKELY